MNFEASIKSLVDCLEKLWQEQQITNNNLQAIRTQNKALGGEILKSNANIAKLFEMLAEGEKE